jgi:hypothetical protein
MELMGKIKQDLRPLGSPQSWAKTPGTYISAHAHMDGADQLAIEMERKWGVDRLRLLVDPDLREKFDRQRLLYNAACWHGDLEAVRRESQRTVVAYSVLDGAAEDAGKPKLSPLVWELALADGTAVAIVRSPEDAHAVSHDGRRLVVYTLEELGRMLEVYQEVTRVKEAFPGSTVTQLRRQSIPDPLAAIRDAKDLDQNLNDDIPAFS